MFTLGYYDRCTALLCEAPIDTIGTSFVTLVYQKLPYGTIGKSVKWEIASDNNESYLYFTRRDVHHFLKLFSVLISSVLT